MTSNNLNAMTADLETPGQGLAVIDHRALFRPSGYDDEHFGRVMGIGDTTPYNQRPNPHHPTDWHIFAGSLGLQEAMDTLYGPLMDFIADHMLGDISGNVCFIGADANAESFTIGQRWADRHARFFVYTMDYLEMPHGDGSFLNDMPIFDEMRRLYAGDEEVIRHVLARVLDSITERDSSIVLIQPDFTPAGFLATLFPMSTSFTA